MAPISLAAIWMGGTYWRALLAVLALGLAAEWAGLCGTRARAWPGAALLAAVLSIGLADATLPQHWGLLVMLAAAGLVTAASRRRAFGAGVLYIGVAYLALLALRAAPAGRANVLFVMLLVWGSDIGAYLAGRLIGGPRMAPLLSPGKTWSGAAGGVLAAIPVGVGVALLFGAAPALIPMIAAVAAALSMVSQAGDLLESGIKRRFGRKDSGNIIPGHGGLFDRLDGVLTAAPAAALLWLSHGQGAPVWK